MTGRITTPSRNRVVTLWLLGENYREIQAETGVSLGAIAAIIDEERKRVPDVDGLRGLNVALQGHHVTIPDALRGATIIQKVNDLDIDQKRALSCLKALSRYERPDLVLDAAQELMELEASSGRPYQQILADVVAKEQRRRRLVANIGNLERKEGVALASLHEVDGLRAIAAKMKAHRITADRLDGIIENGVKLERLGFTLAAAESLATELARIGMDPSKASAVLAAMLAKYEGLEGAVAEEQRLGQAIKMGRTEIGSLSSQIDALRRQAEGQRQLALKAERQFQDEYAIKRRGFQVEMGELERRRDTVAAEAREYAIGLRELRSQGEEYREELNLVKFILGVKGNPSEFKRVRLDYDVLIVGAALNHIKAKGLVGLKVPLKSVADMQYRYMGYYSDVGLADILEWALKALQSLSEVT